MQARKEQMHSNIFEDAVITYKSQAIEENERCLYHGLAAGVVLHDDAHHPAHMYSATLLLNNSCVTLSNKCEVLILASNTSGQGILKMS